MAYVKASAAAKKAKKLPSVKQPKYVPFKPGKVVDKMIKDKKTSIKKMVSMFRRQK